MTTLTLRIDGTATLTCEDVTLTFRNVEGALTCVSALDLQVTAQVKQ